MIKVSQLREFIIKPALESLVMYSQEAEELLVFTCAVESEGGSYLHQINGPALGIFQMEPKTYNDIWQNFINFKMDLKLKLLHNFEAPVMPPEDRMVYDLRFAAAMARIFYERVKQPLPAHDDLSGIWSYYKEFYNTLAGKAEYQHCLDAYDRFIHS